MITTGIIKRINVDSKNYSNNKYIVEISLFKSVNDITTDKYTYEANACTPPGLFSPYEIGDKVYIGFINGQGGLPVILGKIYQGLTEEDRAYALFTKLKISEGAELPKNTKFGDITVSDLSDWSTRLKVLEDQYYNEGIIRQTIMMQTPIVNLHGNKVGGFAFRDEDNACILTYDYAKYDKEDAPISNDYLKKDLVMRYMRCMTGVAYIPDSEQEVQEKSSVYRGGVIVSGKVVKNDNEGFGGYFVANPVEGSSTKNPLYILKIIKTHSFGMRGLSRDDVISIIEDYLSDSNVAVYDLATKQEYTFIGGSVNDLNSAGAPSLNESKSFVVEEIGAKGENN